MKFRRLPKLKLSSDCDALERVIEQIPEWHSGRWWKSEGSCAFEFVMFTREYPADDVEAVAPGVVRGKRQRPAPAGHSDNGLDRVGEIVFPPPMSMDASFM